MSVKWLSTTPMNWRKFGWAYHQEKKRESEQLLDEKIRAESNDDADFEERENL